MGGLQIEKNCPAKNTMKTFKQYLREQQTSKILHILRGISGSGKSTLSRQILKNAAENQRTAAVLSTDRFFMTPEGEYKFDQSKHKENHAKNISAAIDHMDQGTHHVIIDNTNLEHHRMRPYVSAAVERGYDIRFHDIHENDPNNIDIDSSLRNMERREKSIPGSNHGIEVLRRQQRSYEPFETDNPVQEILK